MLIERLEHIALAVPDAAAAAADYAALLDRSGARLQTGNIGLQFDAAPATQGPAGLRLAFASPDLAQARHRLERRALPVVAADDPARLDLDPGATHGVAISLVPSAAAAVENAASHDIAGLDHVVIHTPEPERAVALYGGRLGLDLRLDRTNSTIGVRQLFFVCGDLVVEIVHSTRQATTSDRDQVWGLAWRADDLERAHARLQGRGVAVTGIREGRRPGTRVFTVKSHVAGVPTLVIGGANLRRN